MIALFQPPWWLYLLTRANTEVLNFSAPSFGMASNHALTASLCQAPVSRFYTIILICKGNKSKRRDGMPPPHNYVVVYILLPRFQHQQDA